MGEITRTADPLAGAEKVLDEIERQLDAIRTRLATGRSSEADIALARRLAHTARQLQQAAEHEPSAGHERPGVLLAVTDVARRDALATWLDEAGLRIVATGWASTARLLLRSDPECFALIITDVELQGGSGLGLATEARAGCPDVPVVLMSAAPPDSIVSRIPWDAGQGETVVLERAIAPVRLTAIVRELLRGRSR